MEAPAAPNFYDFLDRMRHPSAVDIVRSIKSFIVSFSFNAPDFEKDSKRVQEFVASMENTIRDHPLWSGASENDIDNAVEGLEKYLMTKLHSRTFAASPEDTKRDVEVSSKIRLLQQFIRPEHLDIPKDFQNEASWLLAEKELQKMNAFKAPREKLLCIFNCCRVINNLLLNISMSADHMPSGADDFLPILIYVTIKANPPQLHSNLKYIQLYRKQSRLVSEAAYYLTNLVSVETFIQELTAKSISMDELEYESCMQAAESSIAESPLQPGPLMPDAHHSSSTPSPTFGHHSLDSKPHDESYPFMNAEFPDLKVEDVETLLHMYKDVVVKYSKLSSAVKNLAFDKAMVLVANDELPWRTTRFDPTHSKDHENSG